MMEVRFGVVVEGGAAAGAGEEGGDMAARRENWRRDLWRDVDRAAAGGRRAARGDRVGSRGQEGEDIGDLGGDDMLGGEGEGDESDADIDLNIQFLPNF